MKKKIYLITKVFINDGLIETDTNAFNTEYERDKEWNRTVHSHNNLIRKCYEIDLDDIPDNYFYEWDNQHIEFYDKEEVDMHHDYFIKDETTIEVPNETC